MSRATLRLPTPLRTFCGGADELPVAGENVGAVLRDLVRDHPGLAGRILDDEGSLRRFVNVFVDGRDARGLGGLEAEFDDGSVLTIVPAVAGGSDARDGATSP
ncbi:MAG: ubiquitin-like small modifier protein 1 [Planctomycetota bacterium]